MSSYEAYFNILPSDLCAASNFRHLYLFLASSETLLSICTSGLALTLSVAMYTHQHFIERHTNNHPFLQASTFLVAGVTLAVKTVILTALTYAIALNDAEIFVACTQEDLLHDGGESEKQCVAALPPPPAYSPPARGWRHNFESVPGPYTCDAHRSNSLYSSANRIAISYHRRCQSMSTAHDPTEKARKCFQRRQACLYRQRNMLAPFPIIQLLCGAISMVFWFSIDDSGASEPDGGATVKDLLESQMPSLRLFNGYLILWSVCLLHSPLFLLVSTWHYARVDWQMQILAVHQFLSRARDDGDDHNQNNRSPPSHRTSTVGPCCHRRKSDSLSRAEGKIRNSRTLKRALRKADKLHGGDKNGAAQMNMDTDSDSTVMSSESASQAYKRENRVAALSALTRQKDDVESNGVTDRRVGRKNRRKRSVDSERAIHRSHMPYSVPVSPESLSFIMTASGSNQLCYTYDDLSRTSTGDDDVPDIRFPTSIKHIMSNDSSTSSDVSSLAARESMISRFDVSAIQNVRTASMTAVPILKPVIRALDRDARTNGAKRRSIANKHVSFPAQPSVEIETTLPARRSLNPSDSLRNTSMMTPMTAISEESSGASSFGSILLQTPQRAVLMPAPRSAQAEMIRFDRKQ